MTRPPRGLSREEAALWARIARTVTPLAPVQSPSIKSAAARAEPAPAATQPIAPAPRKQQPQPVPSPQRDAAHPLDRQGLDASWDRKLARGGLAPDFTLDLHGLGLAAAHTRLDGGLSQALSLGARVVLVIAGRPRPAEAADRGSARGAIRAKLIDWLAAGPHASSIAAVRTAHRRHGGAGAVYVVLRRRR